MIPDGLPAIASGAHRPGQGQACVMEYVALIKGEEWTDQPECTDPLVGLVARMVNDRIGNEERAALMVPRVGRLLVARPLTGRAEHTFLTDTIGMVCSWIESSITESVMAFRLGRVMGEVEYRRVDEGTGSYFAPIRETVESTLTKVVDYSFESVHDPARVGLLDLVLLAHRNACEAMDRDNTSLVQPSEEAVLAEMRKIHDSLVAL